MPAVPLKLKNKPAAETRAVLEDEMSVEQHRFDFGQEVVMAVQIRPARLHHSDLRVAEVVNRALEEICRRDEVGIEHGDQFAGRAFRDPACSAPAL